MALSSGDRKNLSKKYIFIPDENTAATQNIAQLDALVSDLQNLDQSYKNLFDSDNNLINFYHPELDRLLGQVRTSIVESDLLNSAKKLPGNYFFPNQITVPTPFLSDGIWKELKAYAKNKAVGKEYSETYVSQDSEVDKITAVTTLTSSIQTDYSSSERQTGTPDIPPPPPFTLGDDLQSLKDAVDEWETWLNAQKSALLSNTDTAQSTEITNALADVNNALAEITSWKALADYDIGGKVDDPGLAILNSEVAARNVYIPLRVSEIEARLGDVVQAADGSVTLSGLYGGRYVNIDSRINLAEGTLTKQTNLELAKRVQTEIISNNNSYLSYLTNNVLVASKLTAAGNGTNIIQVTDGSLFNISDTVYLVSETQAELSGTISYINTNTITLDFNVPATFTVGDISRLIKES